jgi:ABC-type dipeptide/oligopeptide/nickel transport system ATPase component
MYSAVNSSFRSTVIRFSPRIARSLATEVVGEVINRQPELRYLQTHIAKHSVLTITGHKNCGKSTVMLKLMQSGEEQGWLFPIYINLRNISATGPASFANAIYEITQTAVDKFLQRKGKSAAAAAEAFKHAGDQVLAGTGATITAIQQALTTFKDATTRKGMKPDKIVSEALDRVRR